MAYQQQQWGGAPANGYQNWNQQAGSVNYHQNPNPPPSAPGGADRNWLWQVFQRCEVFCI